VLRGGISALFCCCCISLERTYAVPLLPAPPQFQFHSPAVAASSASPLPTQPPTATAAARALSDNDAVVAVVAPSALAGRRALLGGPLPNAKDHNTVNHEPQPLAGFKRQSLLTSPTGASGAGAGRSFVLSQTGGSPPLASAPPPLETKRQSLLVSPPSKSGVVDDERVRSTTNGGGGLTFDAASRDDKLPLPPPRSPLRPLHQTIGPTVSRRHSLNPLSAGDLL
jgi:hypothetical protein